MKKLTATLLIIAATFGTGCKKIENLIWKDDSIAVSVISDGTDPLRKNPDASDVINILRLNDDTHLYSGMTMRYRSISDVALTPVQSLKVPPVSAALASDQERVQELKTFKQNLRQVFDDAQKNNMVPMKRSCIYSVVVSEANACMEVSAAEHYMIIYSNMLDHDRHLDFYSQVLRDQVQAHPMEVIQSLRKVAALKNVTGLRVIIVYQSMNGDGDTEDKFLVAANFYKTLFENGGATCVIVPSLEAANLNEKK
ncbi:MAG: hypothetical protein JWO03_3945 [Bacteroidetes bacterium]|nr:hypothetical protein [Bacteroidota bacterium]